MKEEYAEKINDVLETELDEIRKRREAVGLNDPVKNSKEKEVSGLALSGGGIRSACFNLGLLQVLYQKGILRQIDYLSTVSGGGYVGSFLSTLTSNTEKDINWTPEEILPSIDECSEPTKEDSTNVDESKTSNAEDKAKLGILPDKNGRQPNKIQQLSYGGMYLRHPVKFTSHLLFGAFLINVFAFSALIACCALVAWLYRLLDDPNSTAWLTVLGFQGDLRRAFVPAFVLFILWFVCFTLSNIFYGSFRRWGPFIKFLCGTMLISIILAIIALLNTGDISIPLVSDWSHSIRDTVNTNKSSVQVILFIIFALALIPFFKFPHLLRSGIKPQNPFEGWTFSIVSRVFLYGTPLLLFGYLAKENVSNWMETRSENHVFARSHVKEWDKFLTQIDLFSKEKVSKENGDPAKKESQANQNYQKAHQYLWKLADSNGDLKVRKVLENYDELQHWKTDHWAWRKWLLILNPFSGHDKLNHNKDLITANRQWFDDFVKSINEKILLDPEFYKIAGEGIDSNEGDIEKRTALLDESKNAPVSDSLKSNPRNQYQPISDPTALKVLIKNGERLFSELKELRDNPNDTLVEYFDEYQSEKLPLLSNPFKNKSLDDRPWLVHASDLVSEVEANYQDKEDGFHSSLYEIITLENAIRENNWLILRAIYGENIRKADTIFATVVLEHDQSYRLSVFFWCAAISIVTGFMWSWNSISIHHFYRDQLANMWINPTLEDGKRPPLSKIETAPKGGPYHLINAAINYFGRKMDQTNQVTGCFLMSPKYCGSKRTGYTKTESYQNGKFDIATAMAVSGAAVSPTIVQNPLLRVLLLLSNFRLGQWLPNPKFNVKGWPSPIRLLFGYWRSAPEDRAFCYISDGGHYDNSGIGALLERRCRVIIASDASEDPTYRFDNLMNVVTSARAKYGVRITPLNQHTTDPLFQKYQLPLDDLIPIIEWKGWNADTDNSFKKARRHFIIAKIEYPLDELSVAAGLTKENLIGYLIFLKPNYDGDEDSELIYHRLENSSFPHDKTLDQFYEPARFESYRHLGFHIGQTLVNYLAPDGNQNDQNIAWLSKWSPPSLSPKYHTSNIKKEAAYQEEIERLICELQHPEYSVREQALMNLEKISISEPATFSLKHIKEVIKLYKNETDVTLHAYAKAILMNCERYYEEIKEFFDQMNSKTTSDEVN